MKTKLLLILSLIILVSCYKEEYILFLGENIYVQDAIFSKEFEKEYQKKINDEFIVNQFYIKDFYLKLDENALNINTENHLLDLIKDSYQIILNLGNNDLNYFIKNNKSILSKDRELYDYYLHHCLEILTSYTDNIQVIPFYNSLMIKDEQYQKEIFLYNEIIYQNCLEFKVNYINIEKMSYFVYKENYISFSGLKYLFKQLNYGR